MLSSISSTKFDFNAALEIPSKNGFQAQKIQKLKFDRDDTGRLNIAGQCSTFLEKADCSWQF